MNYETLWNRKREEVQTLKLPICGRLAWDRSVDRGIARNLEHCIADCTWILQKHSHAAGESGGVMNSFEMSVKF